MPFGFNCPDLNGQTQNISAFGTPAFVIALSPSGSRVFFQGATLPGVPQYASSTITRAAMVAGLVGAGEDFTPIDFLNLDGATITINGDGEIASITPLPASLLPPAVPAACRIAYSSGAYCDVQGTVAAVEAAIVAGGGGGGGGSVVGPLSTVYVEPPAPTGRGDDATGARGNAGRPFATLDAAIAVMQNGDTLRMSAGTFLPPSAALPALLASCSIVGENANATIINAVGSGQPALDFAGASRLSALLDGFRIEQDAGQIAINADGSAAAAGTFFPTGLTFGSIRIAGGNVVLRYCGTVTTQGMRDEVSAGDWTIDSCLRVGLLSSSFLGGRNITIDQDNDDPLAPNAAGSLRLGAVRFINTDAPNSVVTLTNQARILVDQGSQIGVLQGNALSIAVVDPTFVPEVVISGEAQQISFTGAGAMPDAQILVDLQGARISSSVTVVGQIGAVNTIQVNGTGASIGTTATIGEGVLGNLRGTAFAGPVNGSITTTGSNGRVIPPDFALLPALAGVPTGFPLPFRLAGVAYVVTVEITDPTAAPVYVSARSNVSVELTPAAAAGELGPVIHYWGS